MSPIIKKLLPLIIGVPLAAVTLILLYFFYVVPRANELNK
jgi:hypothetical protein